MTTLVALQGSRKDALIATVCFGLCNHFSTYASFFLVRAKAANGGCHLPRQYRCKIRETCISKHLCLQADHLGRRFLLLEAGVQMFLALVIVAVSLAKLVPAPAWLGWYVRRAVLSCALWFPKHVLYAGS